MGNDNGRYYGYDSASNVQVQQTRQYAATLGGGVDVTRYPPDGATVLTYTPTMDPKSASMSDNDRINNTIELIYQRIMKQSAEETRVLADQWTAVGGLLNAVSDNVRAATDPLTQSWQSPAADVFFARGPGATMQ
ncbi:MAG: hypothetical protein J2P17_24165, partial [Mycobacterium sp.]|nr:hypothetical protein [Mycobacterium sp.]